VILVVPVFLDIVQKKTDRLVTLTLDWVILHLHTFVRHLSTLTYVPNFVEIEETFCGRTDGRTDVRTYGRAGGHLRPTLLGRLVGVDLKSLNNVCGRL